MKYKSIIWKEDKPVKRGWTKANITGFGDEEDCLVAPSKVTKIYKKRKAKR